MNRVVAFARRTPLILLFALTACEHPGIFSSENLDAPARWDENFQQNVIIDMNITGGFAGVNERLQIADNGVVVYRRDPRFGGIYRDLLTADRLANLKALFYENDFFSLKPAYVSDWVDVFYYDIRYQEGKLQHRVSADVQAAPGGLREIIEVLNEVIGQVSSKLDFSLRVIPPDTLRPGQSAELIFEVRNTSRESLTLRFRSGQKYDFYAVPPTTANAIEQAMSQPLWNWANGLLFTQALENKTLGPNDAMSFSVQWDGTDNSGNRLIGEVWLTAELTSFPGGIARPMRIIVQ